MDSIEKTIAGKLEQSQIWHKHIENDINNAKQMASNFEVLEIHQAAKAIADKKYNKALQHFHSASLLDKLRVEYFNITLFDYKISSVLQPLLSNNDSLINEFSKLSYKSHGQRHAMEHYVNQGDSPIWVNTIQHLMIGDFEKVKRNITIIENITLPKLPKDQQELIIDYTFFKALIEKDKNKCEEQINLLISDNIHKRRNQNHILNLYLSQPALGYAKLAWKLGVKVEFDSPFLPRELICSEPLDKYEIQYDFINDIELLITKN